MVAMFLVDLRSILPFTTMEQLDELLGRLSGQREFYESNGEDALAGDADQAYAYVIIEWLRRRNSQELVGYGVVSK